jgi:hypothetical protein
MHSGNKQGRKYLTATDWFLCNFFKAAVFEIWRDLQIDGSFLSGNGYHCYLWGTAFFNMYKGAWRETPTQRTIQLACFISPFS